MLLFLVTQMFPGVLMMIPLYLIMDTLGLLDQLAGLVLVYSTTAIPFCVWTLKGYFDTVPKDLEEAAMIDGCSQRQAFFRVMLPLAAPAIAVTALFGFMAGWTEIVLAWTMLENPGTFTLAMALYGMVGQYGTTKPWAGTIAEGREKAAAMAKEARHYAEAKHQAK